MLQRTELSSELINDITLVHNPMHFINGAVSGMAGIILSHPFDTIKTNIQSNNPIKLNFRFLYSGLYPPLIGVGFEKAIVFGSFLNFNQFFEKKNFKRETNIALSGALSGFFASFIVTPVERIKILLQNGASMEKIKSVQVSSLFRGLSATFTRETPGFAIYFSVYENLKYHYFTKHNRELPALTSFFFGGVSGAVAWTFIYPQDLIKTKIQSNYNSSENIFKIMGNIFKEGGLRMFYKGFHLALLRAVPLHAGTFSVMEILKK